MGRQNNIMFSNLRAEMARQRVTIQEVANAIGVGRDAASQKLSGKTPITLADAFKIEQAYFPDHDVRYLFAELLNDSRPGA